MRYRTPTFLSATLFILIFFPNLSSSSPKRQINPENEYKRPEIYSYTAYRAEYRLEQELKNYGSMHEFIQIKLNRSQFLETPDSDAFHLTGNIDWASIHLLSQEGLKTKNQKMSLQYYYKNWPNYIKKSFGNPAKNILKINLEGNNQFGGFMTETYEICGNNLLSEPTYFVIHHDPSTQTYKLILFGDWLNCKEFEDTEEDGPWRNHADSIMGYATLNPINWWPVILVYLVIQNIHYDYLTFAPKSYEECVSRCEKIQTMVIVFEARSTRSDIFLTTLLIPIIQRHTRDKKIMFYPEKWVFTIYVMLLQCSENEIFRIEFSTALITSYCLYIFASWRDWKKTSRVTQFGLRICILSFLCNIEYSMLNTITKNQDGFFLVRLILFVFMYTYTGINLLQQYGLISKKSIVDMPRFKFMIKFLLLGIEDEIRSA